MTRDARQVAFPPGSELVFGPQADRRQFVSDQVSRVFRGWGFSEIVLPAFDSGDTFEDAGEETELYHLTDREGRRLTLRADFTLIAAKALALELRRESRQIRASYEGRVFRFAPSGHGARVEQTQRGLEWVNAAGSVYDAATLMIARECLDAAGAKDALTVIGHAGFVNSVLGESGRKERRLHEALDHKNPSRIRQVANRIGLKNIELLENLPLMTGGVEVIEKAREFKLDGPAKAALDQLEEIYKLIEQAGVGDKVLIDLGETRRSDYYSGFMFKLYHPQVGEDIGGGGRYDRLFDRFGMDIPAVGFGVNLARLTEASTTAGYDQAKRTRVSSTDGSKALKQIAELRAGGDAVVLGEGW